MTQLFRITHLQNLPFLLRQGLHAPSSLVKDPNFVPIGFPTLIAQRRDREVPLTDGGRLSDYIPFYFWYRSPMLYVISKANDPEVLTTPQHQIIYLVSSVETIQAMNLTFAFTDRLAQLDYCRFFNRMDDIQNLRWDIITSDQWGRQFGAERKEIKQAEFLVKNHLPISGIIGIGVMNAHIQNLVHEMLHIAEVEIPVKVKPNFYF